MPAITNAQLQAAPDEVIRATLIALCDHDADLRARVTGVFRAAASAVKQKRKADDKADVQELPEAKRQKTKVTNAADKQELPEAKPQKLDRVRFCVMCEMTYRESENEGKVCWHHPEEPDCEEWCNDQEKNYLHDMTDFEGTLDTVPEAFMYPCCGQQFEDSTGGCRWGKHCADYGERYNDPLRETWPPSEWEESE